MASQVTQMSPAGLYRDPDGDEVALLPDDMAADGDGIVGGHHGLLVAHVQFRGYARGL